VLLWTLFAAGGGATNAQTACTCRRGRGSFVARLGVVVIVGRRNQPNGQVRRLRFMLIVVVKWYRVLVQVPFCSACGVANGTMNQPSSENSAEGST